MLGVVLCKQVYVCTLRVHVGGPVDVATGAVQGLVGLLESRGSRFPS